MGLEKVKQEILEQAREEASRLIEDAKAEARAIMRSAEKQAEGYERLMQEDCEMSAEVMRRRELASAELDVQKRLLAAKKELIEGIFAQAMKRLGSLSDSKREPHIRKLLDTAKMELDVAVVQCSSKDVKFVGNFSNGGKIKAVKNDEMLGGLIAETSDGKLRVDYSYDALLEQVKAGVLGDVARILFSR